MIVFRTLGNALKAAALLAFGAGLGGCALSPFDDDGIVRRTTSAVGVTATPPEPQPFVRQTRPGELNYPPVGVTPPAPSVPLRQGANVTALEAELNALRARNEQAAAAVRPASPYDGKIEPGFKAPEPPPIPAYTGPKVDVPAAEAPKNPAPAANSAKSVPKKKLKDKKAEASSTKVTRN